MKKIKYIALGAFATLLSSCGNDWLDLQSSTAIETDGSLTELRDFEFVLNGAYSSMQSSSYYGADMFCYGDLRGDRARFFVDIVFQRRPVLAVGHDVGEILAEIGGDDDRRIAVAGLYRFHRFGLAHEFPAKLVVVFQRVFDLVAEVHFAEQGVVGAFVDVGHGNFDALGIAIRIPESVDVEPCVQRRNDGYTDHDDPGGRYGDESFEVTTQNLQYVAHCLPSPMDVRPCSRVAIRYS